MSASKIRFRALSAFYLGRNIIRAGEVFEVLPERATELLGSLKVELVDEGDRARIESALHEKVQRMLAAAGPIPAAPGSPWVSYLH
ncbi:MAG TPA: hypothetical protein VF814_00415 [Casimicrobiaceae bacterium]